MTDRFLTAEVGRESWRVGGTQVCRGRLTDRRADVGGNLRTRAMFAHFHILLLKGETKDSLRDPSSFSNVC